MTDREKFTCLRRILDDLHRYGLDHREEKWSDYLLQKTEEALESIPLGDPNAEEDFLPISDEPLAERYQRVRAEEAKVTREDLIERLRKPSALFADLNDELDVSE